MFSLLVDSGKANPTMESVCTSCAFMSQSVFGGQIPEPVFRQSTGVDPSIAISAERAPRKRQELLYQQHAENNDLTVTDAEEKKVPSLTLSKQAWPCLVPLSLTLALAMCLHCKCMAAQVVRGEKLAWAVQVRGRSAAHAEQLAQEVAKECNMRLRHRVGQLWDTFVLTKRDRVPAVPSGMQMTDGGFLWTLDEQHRRSSGVDHEAVLSAHRHIAWFARERRLVREKRSLNFQDPQFERQWHLVSGPVQFRTRGVSK